ncbi:MAG TPA: DNA ligase D [Terriglobia bacterium]|nr:DNA ligase D [Terriglobia bacterium]
MASLKEYRAKRRFAETPEPSGEKAASPAGNRFVVQKHDATRLHYDFRLEIDGVLKSWAVPKGPSLNPADKRLAMQTEDHPLDYADFEGVIPEGHYGAGPVSVWDNGTYEMEGGLPASPQLERGELKFVLHGHKLRGSFVLVKLKQPNQKGKPWLLIKHRDGAADPNWNIDEHDGSVLTGRVLTEIEAGLPGDEVADEPGPAALEGAHRAKMPARLEPMLATLVDKPFSNPDWLFEIKWDGIRALAWIKDGKLELRSRTGRTITPQFPELHDLPKHVRASEAILDGEIVTLDGHGRSNFEHLQSRINVARPTAALVRQAPAIYYLFDVLYADGHDLRDAPLLERKRLLKQLLEPGDDFRYADHQMEHGRELFELAREKGLEGIVGKLARSTYTSTRSTNWVKFKVTQELDAVVGGWTAPRGSREHFGALLLGLYDGKSLRYIGSVGTGFNEKTQREVYEQLKKLEAARCAFDRVPDTKEEAFWTTPSLVARVKYASWTREPRLRAPVFLGLLTDRNPEDCRLEAEAPVSAPAVVNVAPAIAGRVVTSPEAIEKELFHGRAENVSVEIDGQQLQFTNLNKVYFPESGYTKRHLLTYYYQIADYLLPFLKDRPLVLRRYPNGIAEKSFFQKDAPESAPKWLRTIAVRHEERPGETHYFVGGERATLLYLTNLGCIDHNPWASRIDDLEHPDYVFFDLDPSEGTEFDTVVSIAQAIHKKLEALGLNVHLKTSGATGFHIYLPIERGYTYEQVRTFADIVGRLVAAEHPREVTEERTVGKRPRGTVLIDAYQNASGRPLAAAYTVRAFPKAPVSTPIAPSELRQGLRPERLNIKTILTRLKKHGDLWADFWSRRQRLEEAVERLAASQRTSR